MHNPFTVAFEIPNPFLRKKEILGFKYQPKLITIWYCDPERDGSDDSCGWVFPNISQETRQQIKEIATSERAFMIGTFGYQMSPFELIYSIWQKLTWQLHKRTRLSLKELVTIIDLATNPTDNLRFNCIAALEDDYEFERLFYIVYSNYLKANRPFYKHPRWHIHHWSFQVHAWENFKRWAFKRCSKCGGRFNWGESVYSTGFDDSNIYHSQCLPISIQPKETIS